MKAKTISKGILQALSVIIGVAVLIYFLYTIREVIAYIAIAAVVSLIARPGIYFFKKYFKFNNTWAVVVTMLIFLFVLIGITSLITPLIVKQGENLSLLDSVEIKSSFQDLYNQSSDYLQKFNINLMDEITYFEEIEFKHIPHLLNSFVSAFGSLTIGFFSVLFISFFLMKDKDLLHKALYTIVPKGGETHFEKSYSKMKNLLSRYFIGLIFQVSILFILYTILLLIIGVENAIVIAFLVALLNLIPYIGPLIGLFLIVFLSMTNDIGLGFEQHLLTKGLWVFLGYIFAQLIDNFISQPIIFSKSVKSHPLEIFLVIIIGGLLFGIIGMVLAVPVYTTIKVIMKEFLAENKIVKSLADQL